ncbi:beta-1,4-mannosyltransferase [Panaeolus papilionaceus]|nr:beta-1,4-mannosyltransferase [Panaeolus papilionaceus]
MYHAQSFAELGFVTDLIGYAGSKPIPALERLPKVRIHHIPQVPKICTRLPFILLAPIKVAQQVISILYCLLVWIEIPPEFILIQNPPSIPTLALVKLVGYLRGSKVIIDWHNLGYSILALKLGESHIFVRIAKWYESFFGRSAYAHLFVTQAMCRHLSKTWNLQGHKVVLHDRPPRHFHRASTQETHELFRKLQPMLSLQSGLHDFLPKVSAPYSTPLTHTAPARTPAFGGTAPLAAHRAKIASRVGTPISESIPSYSEIRLPVLRPDRPALLVSSTSWTPDEDFSILLAALELYEARAEELSTKSIDHQTLPKVLVIVTGKGPLRDHYMQKIEKLQASWKWVRCISLWLEAEDYPTLLGSADLGISLHSSSSALDLPMKVVDMFGCGLPVCALNFACLNELVQRGKNGLVFHDSEELADQLQDMLMSFPDAPRLKSLTESLASMSQLPLVPSSHAHMPKQHQQPSDLKWTWGTWDDNWGSVMRPLILRDVNL